MRLASAVLAAVFATAGCGSQAQPPPASHTVAKRPPTRKDVIEAVMASHAVKLSVHPSCRGVGTDKADTTIGAYLSGFLAALENPAEKNYIETSVTEARSDIAGPVWRCEFTIRHAAGEEEWGWGVRFDVRRDNGKVVPQSFFCTGAG